MGLDIAVEVVRNEIIVTLVSDRIAESNKVRRFAETATFDGIEDFGEIMIELEFPIIVSVTKILDVFGEGAEEKNVGFTDFPGDLDL